jgi:serine/threonine-protein kinase
MAVPFDLERLEVTGAPVKVLDGVVTTDGWGQGLFSFSSTGTLVFVPGGSESQYSRIVSVGRDGGIQPIALAPRQFRYVRVSPEGAWLAIEVIGANNQIWLYELERGTLTRLTSAWDNEKPVWTRDGQRITFNSNRNRLQEIFWRRADGGSPAEKLNSGGYDLFPTSWSPDGKLLAYTALHPATQADIWLFTMDREASTEPFLATEAIEEGAEFSPDGRWLSYCTDETGRFEVYVQPVSGTGRRLQISTEGGTEPGWARDGREIYYRQAEKMMAVSIDSGPELVVGKPEVLFEIKSVGLAPYRRYGITPDGRFVMIEPLHGSTSNRIHVVLKWFDELKRLVPTEN